MKHRPRICTLWVLLLGLWGCSNPSPEDLVRQQVWTGELRRLADERVLSPIQLRFVGADTLLIYANALYGAQHDTLRLTQFSLADSSLAAHDDSLEITRRLYYAAPAEGQATRPLVFVGPDHFALLWPDSAADRRQPPSFYRHTPVPLEARKYLQGTWAGELESESAFEALMINIFAGGMEQRFVFLDGQRVEVQSRSGWLGTEPQGTYPYHWAGDSLVIQFRDGPRAFGLSADGLWLCRKAKQMSLCLSPQ